MATHKIHTKRGAASLFVVIFTIILLSIITLGFTRLILSEANQTSNNDLSQSAYDSAMAGIEDAKIALLKYHDCVANNSTTSDGCQEIINSMNEGIRNQDCDTVSKVLKRNGGDGSGEVIIQETQNSDDEGNSAAMSQAYTCVTIQEDLSDYRTKLTTSDYLRLIPLRTAGKIDNLDHLVISWYSLENNNQLNTIDSKTQVNGQLSNNIDGKIPLLALQLFQADSTFNLSELSTAKDDNHTNRATLYLQPVLGDNVTEISRQQVSQTADKNTNRPFPVNCSSTALRDTGFFCSAKIEIPKTFKGGNRNEDATFVIVSLPYHGPETDLSLTLHDGEGNVISQQGTQARIDSTGRANNLYRRIETRVELTESTTSGIYPEFAIQMTGDADASQIEKQVYVTKQ